MVMPRLFVATALMILMAPPAFAKLEISNVEACYGPFGPVRKVLEYHPYDTICFRFTVKGARADDEGKCDTEVTWRLMDGAGKDVVLQRTPAKLQPSFGTDSFPASLSLPVPDRIIPGEYTLKVTHKDNLSGEEASFERKLCLKDTEFAIVSLGFFHDAAFTSPAPAGGVVGEAMHFRLAVIGSDRSQGKVDLELTGQVFDKDGKPMLSKPITIVVASADERSVREARACGFYGGLDLTKPGEFTLRITVADRIGKKTATFEAPLKVTAP
jgi:hypothetical protein